MMGVAPCGVGSRREKNHVSWTDPTLRPFLVGHESLTGENNVGFVLVVVPLVAHRTAFPNNDVREKVTAPSQNFASRLWIAIQNPFRRYGSRLKLHIC